MLSDIVDAIWISASPEHWITDDRQCHNDIHGNLLHGAAFISQTLIHMLTSRCRYVNISETPTEVSETFARDISQVWSGTFSLNKVVKNGHLQALKRRKRYYFAARTTSGESFERFPSRNRIIDISEDDHHSERNLIEVYHAGIARREW